MSVAIDFRDPRVHYAAWSGSRSSGKFSEVVKSTDGGSSSTKLGVAAGHIAIDPFDPDHVLVCGADSLKLMESADAGAHWTAGPSLPERAVKVNLLFADQKTPNVYYAGTTGAGVMRYERPPAPPPGRAPVVRVY